MSRVLQVLEISEIRICHIFEFCWPPKMTSTLSKQPTENNGNVVEGRRYIVPVKNKYKALINCYSKGIHVIVFYLISGESEEVGVNQAELIRASSACHGGA